MFTYFQVLILSERLHPVTAQFDQLRAVRFQDAINRATPRRKLSRVTRKDSTETSESGDMELREPDELRSEPLRVQQQLLDDETRALQVIKMMPLRVCFEFFCHLLIEGFQILIGSTLPMFLFPQVELTNLLDTVQETETKMVEMSALNHLMSTHVLQQAHQIEHLYEQVR